VYDGTQFAGSSIRMPRDNEDGTPEEISPVAYGEQFHFSRSNAPRLIPEVQVVGHEEELPPVVLAPARVPGTEPTPRPRPPRPREQQEPPQEPALLPTEAQ
jgi:hypothetical protein